MKFLAGRNDQTLFSFYNACNTYYRQFWASLYAWTGFGKGGPQLACQMWSRGLVIACQKWSPRPLLARTTFGVTGQHHTLSSHH